MNNINRKEFLKRGIFGLGTILSVPALINSCDKNTLNPGTGSGCSASISPSETKGPFPIKTPAEMVKSNIVSDRKGLPLVINLQVQNKNNNCIPLANVYVDIWHCDADGNYSEYGGIPAKINYTNAHFLRGRQKQMALGWYHLSVFILAGIPVGAPHIHVEVLNESSKSLLVTQIAFPEDVSGQVYGGSNYKGKADTANIDDNVFTDSLAANMADTVKGDLQNGYTLSKTIIVNA